MYDLVVYSLKLEEGKYYIGQAHNCTIQDVHNRFKKNSLDIYDCEWIMRYKPIFFEEARLCPTDDDEHLNRLASKYIVNYGIENVRSLFYNKFDLSKHDVKKIKKNCDKYFPKDDEDEDEDEDVVEYVKQQKKDKGQWNKFWSAISKLF